jgi:hypothetical protein
MTRGRRKDTTLPPSRPLAIQRAYRDRKAKYLADLEDRCRKAEEENERLRNELELARSESAASTINSELASKFPRYIFGGKRRPQLNFELFLKPRVGSGVLGSHAESGANAKDASILSATGARHSTSTRTTRIRKVLSMTIRGPTFLLMSL